MSNKNDDKAINQRQGMIIEALMMEGTQDAQAQAGMKRIAELRQQYLGGQIKESDYTQ